MAKYFYGNTLLPELPELNNDNYPYLFIGSALVSDITVYLAVASSQPWYYDSTNSMLKFKNATNYYTITLLSEWDEWKISSSSSTGNFPIGNSGNYLYDAIWTNHNILLDNTTEVWLAASEPVKSETITYTWDLTDITNKPSVDAGDGLLLYKQLNTVITYDEFKSASLTLTIDGTSEKIEAIPESLIMVTNDIIVLESIIAISPYDNYTIMENVNIPEKGLYCCDLSTLAKDATSGTITLEIPKIPPLYEGTLTTSLDEDLNLVEFSLNKPVVENDIIFITYNGVEYVDKFKSIPNTSLLYLGELNADNTGPDFSNKDYFVAVMPNNQGAYDVAALYTKSPSTNDLKLVYYITGKQERSMEISIDKTEIPLAGTAQISIVSDNATDSPTYSYSSSDSAIARVDNTGKIIALQPGTVTITVEGEETDAYYLSIVRKEITISSRLSDEIFICFSNNNWKTAFPNYYTVTDGANPFYSANTFTYNGLNSYRSAAIGHSGTSLSTIKFYLTNNGTIEFPYRITSEKNCDWLTITLDGVQIVRVAGTVNWTTFSKELDAGEHTLELKYTKDGSQVVSPDACAIGYLRITGILPSYYLVKANNTLYTIVDNALKALTETQISSALFEEQGSAVIPTSEMLVPLTDPEVFCWWDNDVPPIKLKAIVTGTSPVPQTMTTQPYEIPTTGIESISIVSSEDILFSISFDGGQSWLWYEPHGKDWFSTDNTTLGMTKDIVMNIPTDEWYNVSGTATQYQIKFILPAIDSYVTSIVVDYINDTL